MSQPTSWSYAGQYLCKASFFLCPVAHVWQAGPREHGAVSGGLCSCPSWVLAFPAVFILVMKPGESLPVEAALLGDFASDLWGGVGCRGGDCGARLGICLLAGIAQMWYPPGASASRWCSSPAGILARLHWERWTPEQERCCSVRGALALSLRNDDEGMNCTILSVYGVWQDWELKGIKLDNSWCSSSWHPFQGHNMNKLGCGKVSIQPWACQVFSLPLKSIKVTGFECKILK